ncbi:MAG: PQQ-dependent sugar dehydrogenase [Pseudomonadota bacterium]
MIARLTRSLAWIPFALLAAPGGAQTFESSAGPVQVERVVGDLENPWAVAFLPDGRMLVTERDGRLLLATDAGATTAIAGVPDVYARAQGGLLDVALAHDFAASGRIYLSYAKEEGRGAATAVSAATLDAEGASLRDVEEIFVMTPATRGGRHFGSRIVVAPEGDLFVTLGDRGDPDRAQETSSHHGTIVRLLPDGTPHPDNPFASGGGGLAEIYSWGHRNVQGAELDPSDGRLWTVEHGARGGDEINRPDLGVNHGWPVISYGRHYSGLSIGVGTEAPGMAQPDYYWDPSIAPSGLTRYDGALFPDWQGDVFVGALKFALVVRLDVENGEIVGEERLFEEEFGRVRDIRTGPDGALWFLTDERDGGLYRITPAG